MIVLDVYVGVVVGYHYVLLVVSRIGRRAGSNAQPDELKNFAILIPAHNEEKVIGRLLSKLQCLDYPQDRYKVYVVADNCTDETAGVAERFPVNVFERTDDANRGKGFALAWALENSDVLRHDAVVFIDADCIPSEDLLRVMNGCLSDERPVIQVYYGSFEPDIENPIGVLLYIANIMENRYFWYPKSLMKDPAIFLQGTGMGFTSRILEKHKWNSFSIVEDLEYSVSLLLAGERIGYTMETAVYQEEPATAKGVSGQKQRCASGTVDVIRRYFCRLFKKGLESRSGRIFDAATSLLMLNKTFVAGVVLVCVVLSFLEGDSIMVTVNEALFGLLTFYVVTIIVLTVGLWKTCRLMLSIPRYFAWMTAINFLALFGHKRKAWVRTER